MLANFATLIDRLSPTRTLVGIDYPGSGDVPARGALRLDDLADELVAAVVAAGHERFPVVGISLGAAVAVTAAQRHPQHVTGVALSVGFARADAQVTQFSAVVDELLSAGLTTQAARVLLLVSPSPDTLAGLDADASHEAVSVAAGGLDAGVVAQLRLAAEVDVAEAAGALRVPAEVYVSGQDRIVLPASTRRLGHLIVGATVVEYSAAGHIYTEAEAGAWATDVARFLRRHGL